MLSFRATFCTAVTEKPICGVSAVKHGAARRNRHHKKVPSLFLRRILWFFWNGARRLTVGKWDLCSLNRVQQEEECVYGITHQNIRKQSKPNQKRARPLFLRKISALPHSNTKPTRTIPRPTALIKKCFHRGVFHILTFPHPDQEAALSTSNRWIHCPDHWRRIQPEMNMWTAGEKRLQLLFIPPCSSFFSWFGSPLKTKSLKLNISVYLQRWGHTDLHDHSTLD